MSDADVRAWRADTPGCDHIAHLNNAGAALMPRPVVDTVVGHLERESAVGAYEAQDDAQPRVEAVRASLAELLHCAASEVALTENATRAWQLAFYGLRLRPGDRIVTGRAEYASNVIAMLQVAERTGAVVDVIPDTPAGTIDVDELARRLDDDVTVIALTHVPTFGGGVNPAVEVGRLAGEIGATYLVDATQSVGQLVLDVGTIGCDVLVGTGRKFLRGPRGTGFLYAREAFADEYEPPFLDSRAATWTSPTTYAIHAGARRFECWESNIAAQLGLGAAVDYALAIGLPRINAEVVARARALRAALEAEPRVHVLERGEQASGIVTFRVPGVPARPLVDHLRRSGVNTVVSPPEYARLAPSPVDAEEVVRASPHYYNDATDVSRLLAGLHTAITDLS